MRRPRVEYSAPLSRSASWLGVATVLAAIVASGLGACQEGFGRGAGSDRPVPVSEVEAAHLLTHLDVPAPGAHDIGPEMFRGEGRYYRRGLGTRAGAYTVSGNEVCVSLDGDPREPFCRYLFSVNGGYAISASRDPTSKADVIPLSVR